MNNADPAQKDQDLRPPFFASTLGFFVSPEGKGMDTMRLSYDRYPERSIVYNKERLHAKKLLGMTYVKCQVNAYVFKTCANLTTL